ncbi:hypothetical protein AK88_00701 [Plasmodium fragile]|uniref:GRIP domain-containing protein n=1 Tax=Plasmodium fragile TaxID=5857 RepID=A0A0D9QU40_PLAFR|nr:uncharacterized protein AK88_00701 [Plasmodium fragile]KJP89741.1 hypothetical protein AK88_00701 [Plasmodium fragile]
MNIFEENEVHDVGFQPDGGLKHDGGLQSDDDLLVNNPNHEHVIFPPTSMNAHNSKNQHELKDSDLFLTLNNNFAPSKNSISEECILKEGEVKAHPWKDPGPTSQDLLHCYKGKDDQDEKKYLYSVHSENEATSIELTYDGFLNDNSYCKSRSMSMNFTDHSDDYGGSCAPPVGKVNDNAQNPVKGEASVDRGDGGNNDEQCDNQEGDTKVGVHDEENQHSDANQHGDANKHIEVNESCKVPGDGDHDKDGKANDDNGGGHRRGSDNKGDDGGQGYEEHDEEGAGSDNKEAKEGSDSEGNKVDEHNGGEVDGRHDNLQQNAAAKNSDEEEGMHDGVDAQKANPVQEVTPVEEGTPADAPTVADLQSEITQLKEDIQNMKKEKIHLLAKFKAYTLNNKREIERLEVECKGRGDELRTLEEECRGKECQIEQLRDQLAQLQEAQAKMDREAKAHAEEVNRLQTENDCLKVQIEEEQLKLEELQSSISEQCAQGNKLKLDLQDKDVLFLFSTESNHLVCFTKDGEYHIVEEELFRQSYPTVHVPTCVQDEHLNQLTAHKKEQAFQVETIAQEKARIEEEKACIEEEFQTYKNKVNTLINETNDSWKHIEEKNDTIQKLHNSLLKYEEDIESYKNEISSMTEKYKVLEGQVCKEKNIREQQNVLVAELKKQMQREKAEIRKKCKEQFDEECQQKVNEVKAIFSEKEALLQDKIQMLLRQVDRMVVLASEEKSKLKRAHSHSESQSETQPLEESTAAGEALPPLSGSPTEETWRSGAVAQETRDVKQPARSEIGSEGNIDSVVLKQMNTGGGLSHCDAASHFEKDKNDDDTRIPIYPNEYKKIRKKLDKYELLISKEKKDKKNLLEHINALCSQIKNYESISGNYEHVLYQKNILQNFIAQIPSNIKIDDYVSVIYNTFNFSAQEIELINAKRAKR